MASILRQMACLNKAWRLKRMVGGSVTWATGEARVLRQTAPYVPDLHDWRHVMGSELTEEEAAKLKWRDCDADNAFSALLKLDTPLARSGDELTVGVRVSLSAFAASPVNGWYLIGDKGVLIGDGVFARKISPCQNPWCKTCRKAIATCSRSGVPWRRTSWQTFESRSTCPTSPSGTAGATRRSRMPSEAGRLARSPQSVSLSAAEQFATEICPSLGVLWKVDRSSAMSENHRRKACPKRSR